MAAYRGVSESWGILCSWTSDGCNSWISLELKGEGPLDWNSGWLCCAINSSSSRHRFHQLEKPGL